MSGVKYPYLTALLTKAIQQLSQSTDNSIEELKAANDDLRAELRETINSQDAEIDVLRREIEALRMKP